MSKKVRLYVLLGTVAVVLLGAGVVVSIHLLRNRIDAAIPQADLFGTPTPGTTTTPSGSGQATPTASPTPPPGSDIKGPLNILIVGLDTREDFPGWQPHADAVMILHVNADLTSAYMTSLPRDLVVDIPAFAPAHFGGERSKLTHAMTFGSTVPGSTVPNVELGFQLLAQTVTNYTKINHFDAGAIITFNGMRHLVDALGGIDMFIDQQTESIHLAPNADGRTRCASCAHGVTGPAMTYNAGTTMHLVGWQALDYARQRYIPGGDYARQRHQRQMIKAILVKVRAGGWLLSMTRVSDLIDSLGETLTFDGRGRKPTEFVYALHNLAPDKITLIGLPGSGATVGGAYIGENLDPVEASFFAAMNADTLPAFLSSHPALVNPAVAG